MNQPTDENDHYIRELKQKINILLELERDFNFKVNKLQELNKQIKQKLDSKYHHSKDLEQEKIIQKEVNSLDANNSEELEVVKQNLKVVMDEKNRMEKELSQQKLIMNEIDQSITNKISELEESNKVLKEKLHQKSLSSKDLEQEKIFLDEVSKNEKSKAHIITKKYYLTIALSGVILAGVIVPYSLFVVSLVGEEYQVEIVPRSTAYTIQNLRGDTIDTYLSWRLVSGDIISINILNSDQYDPEIIESIKNSILSEKVLEIDNSLLYKGPKGTTSEMFVGWQGAMNKAAKTETSLYIPVKFEIIESKTGEGDITIELTNQIHADGFAGWTTSIADASQNQILKSRITIFEVDTLSNTALETVIRHEMGHAFGLAHSTASEDLMYPIINTNFPYISECDIDAITLLYDGGKSSQVVCEI